MEYKNTRTEALAALQPFRLNPCSNGIQKYSL